MWTPIIPNTSMIVFANGSSENKWALDLFINPSQKMWLILAATIMILIVIGAIIIILHCQEKAEDNKQRESHFDFL
jgi:flagellar basal body-associated protein FliL